MTNSVLPVSNLPMTVMGSVSAFRHTLYIDKSNNGRIKKHKYLLQGNERYKN